MTHHQHSFADEFFLHKEVLGELRVSAFDAKGRILWSEYVGRNRIVDTGRRVFSKLLGGIPPTGGSIPVPIDVGGSDVDINSAGELIVTSMRFGSGGHNPSTSVALAVAGSDIAISVPLVTFPTKTIDLTTYPSGSAGTAIQFRATMGLADANGETISETGLFCTAGIMIAKKNFSPVVKTGAFGLYFEHRLIF